MWGDTPSFSRRYIITAFSVSMRSASLFLLWKLRERFYLIGLELSIMVLELMFDYKSDWLDRMSFKFIVYPK